MPLDIDALSDGPSSSSSNSSRTTSSSPRPRTFSIMRIPKVSIEVGPGLGLLHLVYKVLHAHMVALVLASS